MTRVGYLSYLFLFICNATIFLTGCNTGNSTSLPEKKTHPLNRADILSVDIKKQYDTTIYKLSDDQITDFAEKWNHAPFLSLSLKYVGKYTIIVHLKSDSPIQFNIRDEKIMSHLNGDYTFALVNAKYCDTLWKSAAATK